jgi:hypothetical protein
MSWITSSLRWIGVARPSLVLPRIENYPEAARFELARSIDIHRRAFPEGISPEEEPGYFATGLSIDHGAELTPSRSHATLRKASPSALA